MADLTKLDLNDPNLALPDEAVEYNLEGDAFAGIAPVPDGKHFATLSLGQKGFSGGTTKNGNKYIMASIEARIDAPGQPHDKAPVFDNIFTLKQQSSGTSSIVGVLQAAGATVPSKTTIAETARLLDQTLKGNPRVEIETRWEAFCGSDACKATTGKNGQPGKGKTVLRYQRNFPETKPGMHQHVVECPSCKNELSAKAKPRRYSAITNGAVQGDQEVPF